MDIDKGDTSSLPAFVGKGEQQRYPAEVEAVQRPRLPVRLALTPTSSLLLVLPHLPARAGREFDIL